MNTRNHTVVLIEGIGTIPTTQADTRADIKTTLLCCLNHISIIKKKVFLKLR